MSPEKFSIQKRIKSFEYAFNGLWVIILKEHNFRIHLLAAAIAIAAGFYFNISSCEWTALTLIISLVLSLEIINSAIEKMADFISPKNNEKIKVIKDIAAAAVLIAAIAALVIAAIIFVPKLIS